MKVKDFIAQYEDKPDAEIRLYVVIDSAGHRTTKPVRWTTYNERYNEIFLDYTQRYRVEEFGLERS